MVEKLSARALDLDEPWMVREVKQHATAGPVDIVIDFVRGHVSRCRERMGRMERTTTQTNLYRHLNFFRHQCYFVVHVPRVRLLDGRLHTIVPDWSGKLRDFTLQMEAYVLLLSVNGMSMAEVGCALNMTEYVEGAWP